jgi:hypothetical protein
VGSWSPQNKLAASITNTLFMGYAPLHEREKRRSRNAVTCAHVRGSSD